MPGRDGQRGVGGRGVVRPTEPLLEYPQYTRPATFRDWEVPEVLRSGDHAPDRPLAAGPVAAPDPRPPARSARPARSRPTRSVCWPSSRADDGAR